MALKVGDKMGDYEVVGVLGAGGMGKVYKVRNVISERTEAMKVLLPDLANEPDLADRFMREIKVLASLHHPNIAALHTASRIDNQLVMIMEFVDGITLGDLAKKGKIPIQNCVEYIGQVLSALSCAHAQGVVHRDIKPANMMLTPEGVIKLMDFGIARTSEDHKLTVTGTTLGSLYYMSPEQVKCIAVDARSDLYSLGITLYELATGSRPFQADSSYALMAAQLQETPRPPIQVDPKVPAALNDIILRALEKDPEKRFQTADEFRAALENVNESPVLPATSGPTADADKGLAEPTSETLTMHTPFAPPMMAAPAPPREIASPAPPQAILDSLPSPQAPSAGTHRAMYMAIGAILAIAVIVVAGTQLPRWLKTRAADATQTGSPSRTPEPNASSPAAPPEGAAPGTTAPQGSAGVTTLAPSAPPGAGPAGHNAETNQKSQSAAEPISEPPKKPGRISSTSAAQQAVGGSPHEGESTSTAVVPRSLTSPGTAPPASTQGFAVPNQAPAGQSGAAAQELQERMVALAARASAAKDGVENLRRQLQSQGLGIRSDMASSLSRMEQHLNRADAALAARDSDAAARSMDLAEREIDKLEKLLGR